MRVYYVNLLKVTLIGSHRIDVAKVCDEVIHLKFIHLLELILQ